MWFNCYYVEFKHRAMMTFGNPQVDHTEITFDAVIMSNDIPNTQIQMH